VQEEINGWLNIDKPLEYSSAKVVAIVKKLLKVKKVGHGGTLDPLATGVLPIAINKATKTTEKMMSFNKSYTFDITFGEERTTGDAEGKILSVNPKTPTEKEIIEKISNFTGIIKQIPPIFSALKVNGKRAYELARSGEKFELKEWEVRVLDLKFIGFKNNNTATLYVECGKGFYVRSLAIDISKSLETVGYISYLRRESVGIFDQSNILKLEKVENLAQNNQIKKHLINI